MEIQDPRKKFSRENKKEKSSIQQFIYKRCSLMTSLLKNIQAGMVSLKTSKVPAFENQESNIDSLFWHETGDAAVTAVTNAYVWNK